MNAQAEILLDRAADLNYPPVVVGGGGITGETSWRRALELPGHHGQLSAQLDTIEGEAARSAEQSARWAADDERRAAQSQPDLEAIAAERAEAAESFARFEAQRPRRVEDLLRQIVTLLEKSTK